MCITSDTWDFFQQQKMLDDSGKYWHRHWIVCIFLFCGTVCIPGGVFHIFRNIFVWTLFLGFKRENKTSFCRRTNWYAVMYGLVRALSRLLILSFIFRIKSYREVTSEERIAYIDDTFYDSGNYDAAKYRKVVNKGRPQNGLLVK